MGKIRKELTPDGFVEVERDGLGNVIQVFRPVPKVPFSNDTFAVQNPQGKRIGTATDEKNSDGTKTRTTRFNNEPFKSEKQKIGSPQKQQNSNSNPNSSWNNSTSPSKSTNPLISGEQSPLQGIISAAIILAVIAFPISIPLGILAGITYYLIWPMLLISWNMLKITFIWIWSSEPGINISGVEKERIRASVKTIKHQVIRLLIAITITILAVAVIYGLLTLFYYAIMVIAACVLLLWAAIFPFALIASM